MDDRLLPSHRNWEVGVPSSLMITLKRDGSQILEKDILWLDILKKYLPIKGAEKGSKFSKAVSVRKASPSQESGRSLS